MPYDTERSESEATRISREVREEHRSVLLELRDRQNSININNEFTQQDVKRCLAKLVLLVQRRRPLGMAIRDIENARGKLLANAVRKEIEFAEQEALFAQ